MKTILCSALLFLSVLLLSCSSNPKLPQGAMDKTTLGKSRESIVNLKGEPDAKATCKLNLPGVEESIKTRGLVWFYYTPEKEKEVTRYQLQICFIRGTSVAETHVWSRILEGGEKLNQGRLSFVDKGLVDDLLSSDPDTKLPSRKEPGLNI